MFRLVVDAMVDINHIGFMTNSQAAQLRNEITEIARQLETAKTKAEVRCLKQALRNREVRLTEG